MYAIKKIFEFLIFISKYIDKYLTNFENLTKLNYILLSIKDLILLSCYVQNSIGIKKQIWKISNIIVEY